MPTLYVAGPTVVDSTYLNPLAPKAVRKKRQQSSERVGHIYDEAAAFFRSRGIEVRLPRADGALDTLEPPEFFGEISGRLRGADAVLTIVPDLDPSPYAEALFAVAAHKKVWFLATHAEDVPRLFAGATDRLVRPFSERKDTFREIAAYLAEAETSGTPQSSMY